MKRKPVYFDDIELATTHIIQHVGSQLVLGAPLGLGKPNRLLNAIYSRVKSAPDQLSLKIYTALSLQVPQPKQDLEKRFLQPFNARHFGADYPALDYLKDVNSEQLPANVVVHEFYFNPGSQLRNSTAQRHYISQNYTHVARDLAGAGINLLVQQVAKRGERYSLSSNSDVVLDLTDRMDQRGEAFFVVGVVNSEMPFLGGDAEVGAECFDLLIDDGQSQRLFGIPREAVGKAEHAIGLLASTLVKDGGTLQIGIGALSDALVNGLIIRHRHNTEYREALDALENKSEIANLINEIGGLESFTEGLYGATEMVMDGFMHLRRAGILTRLVYEDLALQTLLDAKLITTPFDEKTLGLLLKHKLLPDRLGIDSTAWLKRFGLIETDTKFKDQQLQFADGTAIGIDLTIEDNQRALSNYISGKTLQGGCYLEGAFFLGSSELYKWLQQLEGDDWQGLAMQRVSQINELYGESETLERRQRRDARFFNTCMMQTLLGAAVSDGLESGQVVSGVGGQYNFVAMAHALDDGRSIIMLRATRSSKGKLQSNICWNYGHTTIPRHMRDIVITEYGIADLRGQCDEEIIKRLLAISDSRFQASLMDTAKAAGKLKANFEIPEQWSNNTPERIKTALSGSQLDERFLKYPFGSDFDSIEQQLLIALGKLKIATTTPFGKLKTILKSFVPFNPVTDSDRCLERMGLEKPQGFSEYLLARLLKRFL